MIIQNTTLRKSEIQNLLVKNGLMQIYPLKNDKLVVKRSDAVQVTIQKIDYQLKIDTKFPTIGNAVQVISTILFAVFFFAIRDIIIIPFPIITGIALGQLTSYFWFLPKIKALQNQVFDILNTQKL